MKLKLCLVLLLVALLVTDLADAKRRRRGRRRNRLRNKKTTTTTTTTTTTEAPAVEETAEDEFDLLIDDGAAMFGEDEEEEEVSEDGEDEEEAEEEQEDPMTRIIYRNNLSNDPCLKKKCGKGRECTLTEKAEPVCTCIAECTHEDDVRRQVCTNHNDTWNSDCTVYKQRCECDDELDGCRDPKNKHLHIEYYGQCRDLGVCTSEEMSDFPRRMREWLFNVMKDLAERQQLGPLYSEMEQEAETDEQKRWVNAAIWRWCELDQHPSDSSVSRHELFPIRATLLSMEHCISPFLDGCDTNGDRDISLSEWAKCLKVTDGEIKERCERIKNSE